MKVAELEGALLDYWVARAELPDVPERAVALKAIPFSSSWQHGGPIIAREALSISPQFFSEPLEQNEVSRWECVDVRKGGVEYGETPLIAAMRAYVASKFGPEVPEVSL